MQGRAFPEGYEEPWRHRIPDVAVPEMQEDRGAPQGMIMGSQKSMQSIEGEESIICPDCGSSDIIKEDNELYCRKCGLVLD